MNKRQFSLTLGVIITGIAVVFSACKKINESTELGGGLIPAVDNINTFDTTITVQAFNDTFTLATDSQRLLPSEEQFIGLINTDPFFGKTDARLFLELKPTVYGAYPFDRKDSIKIDSIVLVLSYLETYGDTNTAQSVNVYEIQSGNFTRDSVYLIRKNDLVYTSLLGTKPFFFPKNLKDSVKAFQDTTINQLRIKLDTNFARRLFNYDTSNAYHSDSAFKSYFKGFALQSMSSGEAVMGFSMDGLDTKLAIYYRQPKKTGTIDSSTVNYFRFTERSATANYIQRNYTGTPVALSVGGALPDPLVYLQNSPGTFATIKIPALAGLNNRVIHRAELIVEQVYNVSDTIFRTPDYLYLDAYDPTVSKYRTIPYDLTFDGSVFNLAGLGVIPVTAVDGSGNNIKTWHFNISRYVQHVLTQTQPLYDLRLFAPFTVVNQFGLPPTIPYITPAPTVFVNSTIVKGRVRVAGNTGPADTNPHRMRLRIVYSKL